ncbi:MAG: DUF5694 domain-containing protein [Steroidobacteraceae bacterium]
MPSKIATALLGMFLATSCISRAASPELLRDRAADLRPTLLVVGTAHFHNPGRDLVNPQVDDVLSPGRQTQIASVVKQLSAFRPTHVVLEWSIAEQAQLDSVYRLYLAGTAQLGRTEKEQLGFRLAKIAGLAHVDAVDWNGPPPGTADQYDWDTYGNSHGQRDAVSAILDPSKLSALNMPLDKNKNVTTWLLQINSDAALAAGHRFYFDIPTVGDSALQPGANYVGQWYARNLRIFANIARVATKPNDRVVVIYGFGHAYLLRQFARESGAFRVVDVADVLHK